jgi:hypothetical protein
VPPADLFFERMVTSAVGERSNLFAPGVSAALAAGAAQARAAAIRAGSDAQSLKAIELDARARGGAVDCRGGFVADTAARLESVFSSYEHVQRVTFRGDLAEWRVDRSPSRSVRWRLSQSADFGSNRMILGLAGRDGPSAMVAVAAFADKREPYSSRLIMRDTRIAGPHLIAGQRALASKVPPAWATRTYMAEARGGAEDGLLPKGYAGAWAFRFPSRAANALAELDPREAVAVEFLFPDGRVRTAHLEVGDFAAGRAFLQVASNQRLPDGRPSAGSD